MISNCGKSETGGINGTVGDQTEKEYWIIPWYNGNWSMIWRHPDYAVRKKIAEYAKNAAWNNNIGYGQNDRLGMWNELKAMTGTHDPASIANACNADCSSSTMAIIKAVGLDLGNNLSSANESGTTYSMIGGELAQLGFKSLSDYKYLNSDQYLLKGDLIMSSGHVCVNVTDGIYSSTEPYAWHSSDETASISNDSGEDEKVSTIPLMLYMTAQMPLLRASTVGDQSLESVKALQALLNLRGQSVEVNGLYDEDTRQAVLNAQIAYGIDVDGECGATTWRCLINGHRD